MFATVVLLVAGAASWQVTQMTECGGGGPSDAGTAALRDYCDRELHYLALGLPALLAAGGAVVGTRRRSLLPFVVASAAGACLAVSPIAAALTLG